MITDEELNRRLNRNGWQWDLISTATPGIVRIQLGLAGPLDPPWRKCIEAPTFRAALDAAETFATTVRAEDYAAQIR